MFSLDGLFGLPRKNSSGVSHRDALHGDVFFCDQVSVDAFVNESIAVRLNSKVHAYTS